jgi:pumilio homology domain family member 6
MLLDTDVSITRMFSKALLSKLADKAMVSHTMIHKAMLDYFTYAELRDKVDMAQSLSPHMLKLLTTKDGTLAACHAIGYLTSKVRFDR